MTLLFSSALRRRTALTLTACLVVSTAGCATYTPIERQSVSASSETRLDLTERGTLELGTRVGAAVVSIDGRVTAIDDSTLTVSMLQAVTRGGDTQQWQGEKLIVPLGYISGYRKRQTSRKRSFLLAGGVLAGVIVVGAAFVAGNSGSGSRGGGGEIPR